MVILCAMCRFIHRSTGLQSVRSHSLFVPSPLQHATWQLGAPTLSMFYGLRLVASIVESQLLLGYTVITDAVQVGSLDWWGGGAVHGAAVAAGWWPGLHHGRLADGGNTPRHAMRSSLCCP